MICNTRYHPISDLVLSTSILTSLERAYLHHIEAIALCSRSELKSLGFDDRSILEIDLALRAKGFVLGARLESWPLGAVPPSDAAAA
jgi:hypothetical protein